MTDRPPVTVPAPAALPDGFLLGAATAAYQIEGAVDAGGRGRSIWDTFSHTPGTTLGGDTGDVAADHYHRLAEDVAIMAELGLDAYRFSIAWPRVLPTGTSEVSTEGLDFYRRLVDLLRDNDIEPWVTLYHWDLPQPLEDAGGWRARDTAYAFADYAAIAVEALGDRVRHWTTLNEPWCSAFLGHASGVHAPGLTDPAASLRASHHLLLGHGLGVAALRAGGAEQVGITLNIYPVDPATAAPDDVDAARRVDGLANRWFLDPLLRGQYPADVLADLGPLVDDDLVADGDLRTVAAPIDVLGVNYYTRHVVTGGTTDVAPLQVDPAPAAAWPASDHVRLCLRGLPRTAMGWEVDPAGLGDVLRRIAEDYPGIPLVVTENGSAWADEVTAGGEVHDPERTDYLHRHLLECTRALADGVPLQGYLVWSLLDNFEWALGYSKRFGVVHVDYDTQRRTPKDSARLLQQVLRERAVPPLG